MVGAAFYTVYYKDEKSTLFLNSGKLSGTTWWDFDLLPGLAYEWYVKASTLETSPNPKLDPVKYWTFQVQ